MKWPEQRKRQLRRATAGLCEQRHSYVSELMVNCKFRIKVASSNELKLTDKTSEELKNNNKFKMKRKEEAQQRSSTRRTIKYAHKIKC